MTIPHITPEQFTAIDKSASPYLHELANRRIDAANKPQAITLPKYAEIDMQSCFDAWQAFDPDLATAQPEPTTGCACKFISDLNTSRCELHEAWHLAIHEWAERAKTAEAKLAESAPYAALRAEYFKQVAEGTTGFYLWEFICVGQVVSYTECIEKPKFANGFRYRCIDISCMVSKDGEPAIRMLRTEAQELQRKLGDTADWFNPNIGNACHFFDAKGTYTYRTKATIKLDGKMVTREQAVAEWESKEETCDLWFKVHIGNWVEAIGSGNRFGWSLEHGEYQLRPKPAKVVKWSDVPVGVMTNKGELRFVHDDGQCQIGFSRDEDGQDLWWYKPKELRLAPAEDQPWIPTTAPCEGLQVVYSRFYECLKITGLLDGYKMEGSK